MYENGKVFLTPELYSQHEWTEAFCPLVAHAGGAVRESDYVTFYTNFLDALVQNYNLGHRVFEFDFYLTSDAQLAAAHDWEHFGNCDGVAMSSDEWKWKETTSF